MTRLAQAYLESGDLEQAQAIYRRLSEIGSPQQRLKGLTQVWDMKLRRDRPLEVLLESSSLLPEPPQLDSLLTGTLPTSIDHITLIEAAQKDHLNARLRFIQARAYAGLGLKNDERSAYERLIEEHPESPEARVATALLEATSSPGG